MLPGGEPFEIAGAREAVLLVHGLTGTPAELRPVGEKISTTLGWHISAPLLPGHGTTLEDLSNTNLEDWQQAVQQSAQELLKNFSRIHLIGLSMGGSLCINYFQSNPSQVTSLTLISPTLWLRSWKNAFRLWLVSNFPIPKCFQFQKKREPLLSGYVGYDSYSAKAVGEFGRLCKKARTIPKMDTIPALIVFSENDPTSHPKSAQFLAKRLTHTKSRVVRIEDAAHVLTLSEGKNQVLSEAVTFLRGITSPS